VEIDQTSSLPGYFAKPLPAETVIPLLAMGSVILIVLIFFLGVWGCHYAEPQKGVTPVVVSNYQSGYIHLGATITLTSLQKGVVIQVGASSEANAVAPDRWEERAEFTFEHLGPNKIFARGLKEGKVLKPYFTYLYQIVESYPGVGTDPDSEGISAENKQIKAWAKGYRNYQPGGGVGVRWQTPEKALGRAKGDSHHIVSLGDAGEITLTFSPAIANGPGPDFAVFENSFSSGKNNIFAELAFVEVSSDGKHFLRFDCVSNIPKPVEPYAAIDPRQVYGVAGTQPNAFGNFFGSPFDLAWLVNKKEVVLGQVDLNNIRYIRIKDIIGTTNPVDSESNPTLDTYDSFLNPIYDPYQTVDSAGFDLEAVAVLNQTGD